MIIKGKHYTDENFINVYCDGRLYTIARGNGAWGYRGIGESCGSGFVFTQEAYDEGLALCTNEGTFELEE